MKSPLSVSCPEITQDRSHSCRARAHRRWKRSEFFQGELSRVISPPNIGNPVIPGSPGMPLALGMKTNTQTTAAVPDTNLRPVCGRALRQPQAGRNSDATKFRQGFSTRTLTRIAILLALCAPITASRAQNFTTSVRETSTQTWNDAIWQPGCISHRRQHLRSTYWRCYSNPIRRRSPNIPG